MHSWNDSGPVHLLPGGILLRAQEEHICFLERIRKSRNRLRDVHIYPCHSLFGVLYVDMLAEEPREMSDEVSFFRMFDESDLLFETSLSYLYDLRGRVFGKNSTQIRTFDLHVG